MFGRRSTIDDYTGTRLLDTIVSTAADATAFVGTRKLTQEVDKMTGQQTTSTTSHSSHQYTPRGER